MTHSFRFIIAVLALASSSAALAQPFGAPPPEFDSIEVADDRSITFRIYAPNAETVSVFSSDLPGSGFGGGPEMTRSEEGIWEASVDPVPAGAYRYSFNVDGVIVLDPRNPSTSETNGNATSLVYVSGSELSDVADVPHGAVAEVTYFSKTLDRFRRMHVYTPPGYESGEGEFPVFYLLHGAMDCDDSWSSVGRAGVIMDNLIAAGSAKPMIVVMPAGHTGPFSFGGGGGTSFEQQMTEFGEDFVNDIRPHVEANYRVIADREHRAIAGLSMGGAQTLNIAFDHLDEYAYVGVYSSGIFGIAGGFGGGPPDTSWEDSRIATLDDAALKEGLQLVWFATGSEDFLIETTRQTVDMLESHGFEVTYEETDGGHTWLNWRDYLGEFAPLLFQE